MKKALRPLRRKAPAQAKSVRTVPAVPLAQVGSETVRIVGIGASAGGLEALEAFLKHVPAGSGLSFVIVQHLDPTHEGIMVELLQRATTMPVAQIKDRTKVRRNRVYVIPPNKDLSILRGVLHLLVPAAPRGRRLPIDSFFRALAEDQRERSVGVILSGMGSDGALGVRAIKAQGGLVLAQAPASAKFDAMPRSVVDAGVADVVAPAEELPARLVEYLRHAPLAARPDPATDEEAAGQLEKIVILLRGRTGHDFALYKRSTLYRRIERRMGLHQLGKIRTYVRYLRENPQELDLLFRELLIGVTSFFRDAEVWAQMRDEVWPALLAKSTPGQALRGWVAGCSTGEEAYSLAMTFREAVERQKPRASFTLQIFATDLDRDAVDQARLGYYPANIATDVTPGRLSRFFVREKSGYRVAKEIREMVIFAPQNLIMDPPFTKLDVLTCRNLLIYFTPELQKRLLPLFHYSHKPAGVLLLGSAESVAGFADLFAPLVGKARLFWRREARPRTGPVAFPSAVQAERSEAPASGRLPVVPATGLQASAEQWLLQHRGPAAVLVNEAGDILFTSGRTGRYLEPAAGKANWNVFAMVGVSLRSALMSVFAQARRSTGAVTVHAVQVTEDGGARCVDVTVQFPTEPVALRGLAMIVFTDGPAPVVEATGRRGRAARESARLREAARRLEVARAENQSTRDEMQTAQQEFKSLNEELQSANEELQSINEELTTSKEEMQSLNEELQTVNAELQAKVDELGAASNDMKNLLNSTEIATVFLDNALCVRRFTEQAQKLFNFIPGDVGRPVTDLASDLHYPEMAADARDTLRTLVPVERSVATRAGRWYALRLMPYRTTENRIEGVVITFTDITVAKKLEAELRARTEGAP